MGINKPYHTTHLGIVGYGQAMVEHRAAEKAAKRRDNWFGLGVLVLNAVVWGAVWMTG